MKNKKMSKTGKTPETKADDIRPKFVLVTGCVGAGKTTLRKQKYGADYEHIDAGDLFAHAELPPGLDTGGRGPADVTIRTCWDADRLDLPRVGMDTRIDWLCTAPAREDPIYRPAVIRGGTNAPLAFSSALDPLLPIEASPR